MIVFGAVLPHPPILLPQIGQGREDQAQATLDAYEVVAQRLRDLQVQRLLLISTHGIVTLNRFHILKQHLSGNFERFGRASLTFEHETDQELVSAVVAASEANRIPLTPTTHWEQSDHSAGVPLLLLGDAMPSSIAVASISFRPPADHYEFGGVIGEALSTISEPTAVIASGDAVHSLTDDAPKGRHPRAGEVQQQYESAVSIWDHEALFAIDETLRREVDESVISPTLVLMGALRSSDQRAVQPRILVSEHPWGVGYVTCLIELTAISSPPSKGRC